MKSFQFKSFRLEHSVGVMPLTTDAIVLGTWANLVGRKILDAGTGTGILSLMLALRYPECQITAIDNCSKSVQLAKKNVANSPFKNIRIETRDFLEFEKEKYQHIISNPPFFKNSLLSPHPHKNSSKHFQSGLSPETLLQRSPEILVKSGRLSFITQSEREDELVEWGQKFGWQCNRLGFLKSKPNKKAHRVLMEFRMEKIPVEISKQEIIIKNELNEYTPQFKALTRGFYTIF